MRLANESRDLAHGRFDVPGSHRIEVDDDRILDRQQSEVLQRVGGEMMRAQQARDRVRVVMLLQP